MAELCFKLNDILVILHDTVDCAQPAGSHSVSMLPGSLHLSPTGIANYLEYLAQKRVQQA